MSDKVIIPVNNINATDEKFLFYAYVSADKNFLLPESPGKGLLDLSRHKDPEKAKKELRNIRDKQLSMFANLEGAKSRYYEIMYDIQSYVGTDIIADPRNRDLFGRCFFELDLPKHK